MQDALRLVYDLLPTTTFIVNQPLRAHWSLMTEMGIHPSSLVPRSLATVVDIKRNNFIQELSP